ncbi:MAG: hypothetical protein KH142_07610 [Slackia piriformis]|uniref:2-hydroxyglutaryl-CoA dehydratase n=1 Tax=Slackia piriformis TaxID=626934 RepID=A0A943V1C4_9ACTN|nr:hypothetical protein [Slackia piriformis]
MNATDSARKDAARSANDPLPLRAANFLGDTLDALDTLTRRYDDGPRAGVAAAKGGAKRTRLVEKRAKRKRDRHAKTKVAFLRYGYYGIGFKFFVEQVLNAEYVDLGESTKRTLEIGSAHSNDFVCAPFKHILGDYIEALEAGADVLVQFTGPCRLGYYGELQESILRDMGYEFEMLNFAEIAGRPLKEYIATCKKKVNPDLSVAQGVKGMLAAFKMVECLDAYNDRYLALAGFDTRPGDSAAAREAFFADMGACETRADVESAYRRGIAALEAVSRDKPDDALRIGIVGEYFTAVDPRSNLDIESKLLSMGVELARAMNITNRNLRYNEPELRREISEYVEYDMGPTSTLTLAAAKRYADAGFDGIVHLKSSGCTPEIDCMPVLQRISRDRHIPVLFLSYDSQTSDTGLDTRIEAFYDMIAMRKASR